MECAINLPNVTESRSCDWIAKFRSSLREARESPILNRPKEKFLKKHVLLFIQSISLTKKKRSILLELILSRTIFFSCLPKVCPTTISK